MPRAARTGVRSRRKINTKHKKKLAAPESDIESFSDKSDSEQEREPQSKEKSQSEDYFPERIVGHRIENGEKQYRVKWKGWDSADNTWEPPNHLHNVSKMVARYEQSVQKKQEKERKKAGAKKTKSPSIAPSQSSSISPKSRKKKKRISSLTPSDHEQPDEDDEYDEYDNKSPQFITKRQKRKSLIQKNTSRFSDDNADYKPSVSVDDDADDEDDEYDMDIDSKSVSNKNKAIDIASDGEADSASDAESEQSEPTYTVEAIVKHRKSVKRKYAKKRADGERCMEYYVKWKDWDSSTNTWEHETELAKCRKLIDQYWEQKNREKEVKKNKKKKKRKEKKVEKKKETAVEVEKKEEKAIEIEKEKDETQIVNKKKIKKKKYKARRTNIFSEEMNGNDDDVEGEHNDEDVKDNDVALEPDATECAEKRKSGKRKLCEVDEGDNEEHTAEPPSKKRRIDTTKKVVMQYGGLDAFFHVLDDGDEADQEALISIVEKYDKRNFV